MICCTFVSNVVFNCFIAVLRAPIIFNSLAVESILLSKPGTCAEFQSISIEFITGLCPIILPSES